MTFIVLLVLVAAEKFSAWRGRVQRDGPWLRQLHRLENGARAGSRPWWVLGWVVLLPVFLVALLLDAIDPIAYGLLALPVHVLVMLFSLGRGDVKAGLGPLRDAWRRADLEGAHLVAKRDLGIDAEDEAALMADVQQHLVWQAYQSFFAVIFWYALLGPAAALAYRLLALATEHARLPSVVERAEQVRHAFDWLPARALALSFGLVGDFIVLYRQLAGMLLDWDVSAPRLVTASALAAGDVHAQAPGEALMTLDGLWQLLVRAAVLWYVVFALWALFV